MKLSLFCRTSAQVGLALVVAFAATSSHAALNVARNGVTWANTWEGDDPNGVQTPDVTNPFDSVGSGHVAVGGSWQVNLPSVTAIYGVEGNAGSSSVTERTYEFRVQFVDAYTDAADGGIHMAMNLGGGANMYSLALYKTGVQFIVPGGSPHSSGFAAVDNVGSAHTYRAVIDTASATNSVDVYLDNDPTPILSTGVYAGASFGVFDNWRWGDGSTEGVGGSLTHVDYISWTDGLHHVAVPEPSAFAFLLAAGSLSWIGSRRR